MSLITILSPSKTMDFDSPISSSLPLTDPTFLKEATIFMEILKKKTSSDIQSLMKLSDKLTNSTVSDIKAWHPQPVHRRPAVFSYTGETFQGLDPHSFNQGDLTFAHDHIFILSAIYGALRPSDGIAPYRCEMGLKLKIEKASGPTSYWKPKLTKFFDEKITADDTLVNLASKEYSNAIHLSDLRCRLITCDFREYRDGKFKLISFAAKRARGMMARYIVQNKLSNPEELRSFNEEGYTYEPSLSTKEKMIFIR